MSEQSSVFRKILLKDKTKSEVGLEWRRWNISNLYDSGLIIAEAVLAHTWNYSHLMFYE
jgi:hypothetical protein